LLAQSRQARKPDLRSIRVARQHERPRVYLFDGSTVSVPDTAENRRQYPLTYNQKPGTGFPAARIGAVISLACGAILKLGVCRYAGKGQYTKDDLAQVYHARWNEELDLRSIKISLQMDLLRCKTPELVRKENWMHVLTYNLIRTIMAQTASQHEIAQRSISFKATLQMLKAIQPVINQQAHRGVEHLRSIYEQMLRAIVQHRVADRPHRFEPRMAKRRAKNYNRSR
jgi:hypothetical protein